MGKLTDAMYDNARHLVTASQAGIKNASLKAMWKSTKEAVRQTFNVRNSIAAFAVLVLASAGAYTVSEKISTTQNVYRVYIDGHYAGVVRNKALIEEQMKAYGSKLKADVAFTPIHQAVKATGEYTVANAIDESTKTITDMVAIRVNNKDVVYVKDQATADALLDKVKKQFAKDGESVTLADKVDFVKIKGDKQNITDVQNAFALIVQGKEEKKTYVVSRGDSLWDIAAKNNVTVDDLKAANPEINNIDEIGEGEQINLNAVKPLISVQSVAEETRDITVSYEIENRDDSSLYEGEEKVLQEGVEGKTKQVVKVTRKNGVTEKEEVVKEDVVTAPQKEIVAKGTKKKQNSYGGSYSQPTAASGNWAYPIAGGYVSSQYGEMRGSKPHLAIDIAAGTGTAVFASNNGKVIGAGDWGDGYGNCVRIDHGNGVMTLYGHLSSINVSVGQAVSRGQRIGGVGMTGEATGPHLHYEVRVNGVHVNPAAYM